MTGKIHLSENQKPSFLCSPEQRKKRMTLGHLQRGYIWKTREKLLLKSFALFICSSKLT